MKNTSFLVLFRYFRIRDRNYDTMRTATRMYIPVPVPHIASKLRTPLALAATFVLCITTTTTTNTMNTNQDTHKAIEYACIPLIEWIRNQNQNWASILGA